KKLVDWKAIEEFRARALNPEHPVTRGTAQNDDIYFQTREASNKFYDAVPEIIEDYMNKFGKETGRNYKLFDYYGSATAENVIIAMGSVVETAKEVVDFVNAKGANVGILSVHLYRPFSSKHMLASLPKTVKKIAVLDRTKEPGALGEPLYLDVKSVFYGQQNAPMIIGGRYGLSSKDTTPAQIVAVYDHLKSNNPMDGFTVGINDDVTHKSIPVGPNLIVTKEDVRECLFYGLGSDGTVGANKNSIKIIGDKTALYAQAYFAYDSKKSGGLTRSHLRFGKEPIRSTYLVTTPNFVACSVPAYVTQYDMVGGLRDNGTFLLNCIWDKNEVAKHLPNKLKRDLARKNAKLYILDANKLAREIGLGGRTNTIMQAAFFKLANVIDFAEAQKHMKDFAEKTYGKKGQEIVKMNCDAIDKGANELVEVPVDQAWASLNDDMTLETVNSEAKTGDSCSTCSSKCNSKLEPFVDRIVRPINATEGDKLPVSAFNGYEDGTFENGTSAFEKRGIATHVPEWLSENCIQCNQCAYVCPHAVIRPFLLTPEEKSSSPVELETLNAMGKGLESLAFKIQVSPLDCTGCGSCVNVCPAKEKAIKMVPIGSELANKEDIKADYLFNNVTYKDNLMDKYTVKGSQFAKPYFEFHGACAGCGETPYIKSITQLFGDRMMIANATGCSSIYGGSAPATPYTINNKGEGPSWANSLFEDNAEFGFGMNAGVESLRDRIHSLFDTAIASADTPAEAKALMKEWIENRTDGDKTVEIKNKLVPILEAGAKKGCEICKEVLSLKQYIIKKSQWIFGGDGWAYDIGYGGVDHVLASNQDVNILVLDTEMYSNTGGQASKSSPTASVLKFAADGMPDKKKDLGAIAMSYGHIYVAQVSMGANQAQFLKAVREAEAHKGPSLIIAYSPCISQGLKNGMVKSQTEEKLATECGYWPIYRYNPLLEKEGKNPLQLDSKVPNFDLYNAFLQSEVRYSTLEKSNPEHAKVLFEQNKNEAMRRWRQYERLASMDFAGEKK
ncbi:MAG: pyruvate:ferredoxin (flavodoxin) oxidoreductase, partial [Fusobacteriaceae bacterium]